MFLYYFTLLWSWTILLYITLIDFSSDCYTVMVAMSNLFFVLHFNATWSLSSLLDLLRCLPTMLYAFANLCLLFLTRVFVDYIENLKSFVEHTFQIPPDPPNPQGWKAWVGEGFRRITLYKQLETTRSLEDYDQVKEEIKKYAREIPLSGGGDGGEGKGPSAYLSHHISREISVAIHQSDGNALIHAVRRAVIHAVSVRDTVTLDALVSDVKKALSSLLASPDHLGLEDDVLLSNLGEIRAYLGSTALILGGGEPIHCTLTFLRPFSLSPPLPPTRHTCAAGGALALSLFGVVKALAESKMLPLVICGNAGGAIVAAAASCSTVRCKPSTTLNTEHTEHTLYLTPPPTTIPCLRTWSSQTF